MFETLLSNKNMKEQLCTSIKNGTVLQAYLFCGADGTGKLTAATAFAAELVDNKQKALRESHPDVIYIRKPEDKSLIPVDMIRDMRADAFVSPTQASRKIYIIDGAHLLNDNGQNALLTLLEQPPSFSVFILLTESREKILPTVISRCSVYDMEYVDEDEGAQFLQNQLKKIPLDTLKTYMKAAQGNVGLAKKMATDKKFMSQVEKSEQICIAIAEGDKYAIAKEIIPGKKKESPLPLLQVLCIYLRDLLVMSATGNTDSLVFCDSILKNKSVFDKIDTNRLYDCLDACQNAVADLERNINPALVTGTLTINLYGGKTLD